MIQSKIDLTELVDQMVSKGYVVKKPDGNFSPGPVEPPESEPELQMFWRYLVRDVAKKRHMEGIH